MSIAHTVQMYLTQHQAPFDVVTHQPTVSSLRTAGVAHIHPTSLAKAVMLEDDLEHSHFIMAVVPASRHVDLAKLSRQAGRSVHLASEEDAAGLFADCNAGAIPPLGPAYGVETLWDDSLAQQQELYFEAGDHEHLVQMKAADLVRLLQDCAHGEFSRPL
ncbi:MAG: YbaK/EbsC family protein [Betaproteobacteria bacterium]|nr:MAG: YbaK/EbsC family protein [Betaproteobacteria bacterium]